MNRDEGAIYIDRHVEGGGSELLGIVKFTNEIEVAKVFRVHIVIALH